MGASVLPERPSIESLIGERPSIESLLSDEPPGSPLIRALRRHDPSAVAKIIARQNTNDQEAAEGPSYRERFGASLANLVRDVPGGSAVTAGAHSVLNRQPYAQSVREIEGAADAVPGLIKWPTRIAGGAAAVTALPGGAIAKGARYGMLEALGQADPDADAKERVHDAMWQGAGGAVVGAVPGAARAVKASAPVVRDVALAPFSGGARGRLANRAAGAIADALETRGKAPAAPPVQQSALEPKRLLDRSEPKRLIKPRRSVPTTPQAKPTPVTPINAKEAARLRLQELLQKNLDEGGAADWTPEAMAARKGVPLDPEPPTNWELMQQIEASLNPAKRMVPGLRLAAPPSP